MSSLTRETILIVDDEPMIVNLCKTILGIDGYNVLTADSAEGALRLLQTSDANSEVHLTLLDVMMPGLNAIEFASRLRRCRPTTKVVLMSGYDASAAAQIAGENNTFPVIWKPFRAESLLRMVENVLKTPVLEAADAAAKT